MKVIYFLSSIIILFCFFIVAYSIFPVYLEEIFLYVVIVFLIIMAIIFPLGTFFRAHVIAIKRAYNNGYGYYDNKIINIKNVPIFRGIPCNNDIYYAYVLIKLNKFKCKNSNIWGAVILKWIKEEKIAFRKVENGTITKDRYVIDLNMNPVFDNNFEIKLYEILYAASNNGILESDELSKWIKKNYNYLNDIFDEMVDTLILKLKDIGYIKEDIDGCKYGNVMGNQIYNDSIQLYGLKKYLEEFSEMDMKEIKEVKLWDEYLIFACLFGITDKVTKQLKTIYPEILKENFIDDNNKPIGFDTIEFVRNLSVKNIDRKKKKNLKMKSPKKKLNVSFFLCK